MQATHWLPTINGLYLYSRVFDNQMSLFEIVVVDVVFAFTKVDSNQIETSMVKVCLGRVV